MSNKTIYSKEEVAEASLEYFDGDAIATDVYVKKYAMKNDGGEYVERTPEDTHRRLAKAFSKQEKQFPNPLSEKEIFSLLDRYRYVIPAGSPTFGIGNPSQKVSLSNCFVVDCMDSYGGICRADERIAQISKRRGGVGIDISPIRPRGMRTQNSSLTTDGIGIFMDRFSNTIREVGQHGRRGALMISISVHHPEIMQFINIKKDKTRVTGANISVRISDEFMEAVRKEEEYEVRWPVDAKKPQISESISAKEVWDALVESNYGRISRLEGGEDEGGAERGMLFWDSIIRNSPADCYAHLGFKTISTNPCGELPLCNLDSCRLLNLNVANYVINPFTENAYFDVEMYEQHVHAAMRLMDDLVEMEITAVGKIIEKIEKDPEPDHVKANELAMWHEIKEKCQNGRRTGLGITGLADCIAGLGQKYGSEESLETVDLVYRNLRDEAYRESIQLAKERGPFPIWDPELEKNCEYLNRLPNDIREEMAKYGRRHIGLLTTPPAGSISIVGQVSNAGEPVYMAQFFRKRKIMAGEDIKPDFVDDSGDKWQEYVIQHQGLKRFIAATGKTYEESPYFEAGALDIDPMVRVKVQSAATQYVDHAISSTINLKTDTPKEVLSQLYLEAHRSGCKGLTIYREGTRDGVMTSESVGGRHCDDCDDASKKLIQLIEQGKRPQNIILSTSPQRPKILECDIHRSKVGGGEWLFFVGKHNNQPYEVFGGNMNEFVIPHKYKKGWIEKNGKVDGVTQYNLILGSLDDENERLEFKGIAKHFNNYEYGAFTRLASLTMRHGTPIKYICEQITKKGVDGDLFSFQRAMARILKKYIVEGEKSGLECPDCGSPEMVYRNGCPACMVCGASKCS